MAEKATGTPASRPIAATTTVPATAGRARRASVVSPLAAAAPAAVTIPPIHAANVPSIHQIGRYHHVLPPPIASHVQGYALKGRSRTISMTLNTTVPTRPMAAAAAARRGGRRRPRPPPRRRGGRGPRGGGGSPRGPRGGGRRGPRGAAPPRRGGGARRRGGTPDAGPRGTPCFGPLGLPHRH